MAAHERGSQGGRLYRSQVYAWRETDAEFAAAWDDSLDQGADTSRMRCCAALGAASEDEVLRRARDGVEEPRFYEGEVCGHVRKYSDTDDLPVQGAPAREVRRQGPDRPYGQPHCEMA
jgi:hypothetical protein